MVYAGDQWVLLPVRDLYDTLMMAIAINAAKDMYDKGEKRLDDFYTKYGDFTSPILKDMDAYNNIIGGVRDKINELYAMGVDPLRSAEGRAAVALLTRNVPVDKIAKLKQSAEVAKEYVKNRGILQAKGLYNPDAEENYFDRNLNTWDTLNGSGVWGTSSPIENQTMDEIIEPIIKHLDYTYDEARTKEANDGNDYYTVTEDRIRQTIADAMKDLTINGTMGGYYYDQALKAAGGDPEKAVALYTDWLVDRGKDHLKEKFEPNKFKVIEAEYLKQAKLENLRHENKLKENEDEAWLNAYGPRTSASGGYGNGLQDAGEYDFASDIYDKGLNNILGMPGGFRWLTPGGTSMSAIQFFNNGDRLIKAQKEFGESHRGSKRDRMVSYRNKYTHTKGLSGELFADYLGRPLYEKETHNKYDWKGKGLVQFDSRDLKRIRTVNEMVTNTAGFIGKLDGGNTSMMEDLKKQPERYLIGGNNIDVYGAYNKPGVYQNDFIISVYDKDTGKKVGEVAYDSHISSQRTTGGFYVSGKNNDATTTKDLRYRNEVDAGSSAVNKKHYLTSRKLEMPKMYPGTGLTN